MEQKFQDGYYVIGTILGEGFDGVTEVEFEVIFDGPYITEEAARANKDVDGGHTWVEYLTQENFQEVTDGDAR